MLSARQGERLTKKKLKLVVDTGVLISAFAFGGSPRNAVFKAFREARIQVSPELLEEYRTVPVKLMEAGKITHSQLKALVSGISACVSCARVVYPDEKVVLCRDSKDDMLLECCLASGATLLITGDRDLLEIGTLPFDLTILTPQEFLARY